MESFRISIRLSVIIPVYNAAPYLERCIRSIEDQNILKDNYEVICINDGSKDNSRNVIIGLQREFDNIKLIDQENKGVSAARNCGIDNANGNFVMMVDADDYLVPNVLKDRIEIVEKGNIEIGRCGYSVLNDRFEEEYRFDPEYDHLNVLNGIDYEEIYERGRPEIRDPHRSVAIFFKRDFLNENNLRYLEGVPYLEDGEFLARVNCLAKKVIFLNGPIYLRTTITGSATQSNLFYSEKARKGFLMAAMNLLQFKQQQCTVTSQKYYLNQSIIHFTICYLVSIKKISYLKQYSQLYNTLKNGPLRKLDTSGCERYYRNLGRYYNFSLHLFYFYWSFKSVHNSVKIRLGKILHIGKVFSFL